MTIEELMTDEVFQEQVNSVESLDELVGVLQKRGISVTATELEAAVKAAEGELDVDALDNIAGGINVSGIVQHVAMNAYQGARDRNNRQINPWKYLTCYSYRTAWNG